MRKYKRRPPFFLIMRLADHELDNIDQFVELVGGTKRSEQKTIERLASKNINNIPEDWFVDDYYRINEFYDLSLEFAIVGLWRCVELFRKRAIVNAIDSEHTKSTYKHKQFVNQLSTLNITENKLRCARSVDELRCLNNAIKHTQRVSKELESFKRWQGKHNDDLVNLEQHYRRLRTLAERYLKDLTNRLNRYWKKKHA